MDRLYSLRVVTLNPLFTKGFYMLTQWNWPIPLHGDVFRVGPIRANNIFTGYFDAQPFEVKHDLPPRNALIGFSFVILHKECSRVVAIRKVNVC